MDLAKRIIEEKQRRLEKQKASILESQKTERETKKIYGFTVSKKRLRELLHGLKPIEKWIFVDLKLYENKEGYSWPGVRKMANDLNVNKDTITDNIPALEAKGFIKITRGKGKRGVKYRYLMLK